MSATQENKTGGKTAIVLGSTGAVGSQILSLLAEQASGSEATFSQVHSFVRRRGAASSPAVQEHIIDYEKLVADDQDEIKTLKDVRADVVFIALGTTRKDAGSAEAFEKIDREYVIKAAEAARDQTNEQQQVIYCSAQAANPKSWFLYPRSKGLTEQALSSLYPVSFLFRPGFLFNANRSTPRPAEKYYGLLTHNVLSKLSDSAEIDVRQLAKSMIWVGAHGQEGLKTKGVGSLAPSSSQSWIIANAEALKLAKSV